MSPFRSFAALAVWHLMKANRILRRINSKLSVPSVESSLRSDIFCCTFDCLTPNENGRKQSVDLKTLGWLLLRGHLVLENLHGIHVVCLVGLT